MNESAQAALEIITPETKARVGKIARLPRVVREELNRRLLGEDGPENREIGKNEIGKPEGAGENGEGGTPTILEWLNGLPEVQAVLAAEFGGRAINGPNLTAWRQGGFQAWCRHREAWERVTMIFEEAADFAGIPQKGWAADKLNEMAAAALGECLREAMAMPAGAEKRGAVLETLEALGKLQRANRVTERAERERKAEVRAVHDDCERRKAERVEQYKEIVTEGEQRSAYWAMKAKQTKRKKRDEPTEEETALAEQNAVVEKMKELGAWMEEMPSAWFDPAFEGKKTAPVEGDSLRAQVAGAEETGGEA